jgi:hypothetical protein
MWDDKELEADLNRSDRSARYWLNVVVGIAMGALGFAVVGWLALSIWRAIRS